MFVQIHHWKSYTCTMHAQLWFARGILFAVQKNWNDLIVKTSCSSHQQIWSPWSRLEPAGLWSLFFFIYFLFQFFIQSFIVAQIRPSIPLHCVCFLFICDLHMLLFLSLMYACCAVCVSHTHLLCSLDLRFKCCVLLVWCSDAVFSLCVWYTFAVICVKCAVFTVCV